MSSNRDDADSGAAPPSGELPSFGRRQLWVFRLLAAALPLALVLGAELTARGLGVGHPTDFLVRSPNPEASSEWVTNRRFGWRFFPPALARAPVPMVIAEPSADTRRVVVLGGSAAQGVPEPAFGLARQLEAMLELRHPGIRFEVLNAAMTAINSHVVLEIADDLASHQPDLFVVYLGNNEVVGPFGAGTVFGGFSNRRSWIRSLLWLRQSHLVQAVTRPPDDGGGSRWRGMEMFLEQRVTADDPRLDGVAAHLRSNLHDLVAIAEGTGAKVVLSTVASNLRDLPPFADAPDFDGVSREIDDLVAEVLAAEVPAKEQDPTPIEADDPLLIRCREMVEQYPGSAGAHFALGRRLLVHDRMAEATTALVAAQDLDALRFRADSRINGMIRQVAETTGVPLADAAADFREGRTDLGPLPGEAAFFEHVHLTFEGNHALAVALLPAVEAVLELAVAPDTVVPMADEVAERLAFTGLEAGELERAMISLVERPPFAGRPGNAADLDRRRHRLAELESALGSEAWRGARAAWERRLDQHPDDLLAARRLAELLAPNDPAAAAETWRGLVERLPGIPAWYDGLAEALAASGDLDGALAALDDAETLAPETAGEVATNRGQILARTGRLEAAEEAFRQAETLRPRDPLPRYNRLRLAVGEADDRDDLEHLVGDYRALVRDHPDFAEGHHNLGVLLTRLGRLEEAVTSLDRAVAAAPSMAAAHNSLGVARLELGRSAAAEAAFRQAVTVDSRYALAHFNLGDLLLAQDRLAEAVEHYRSGLALQPGNGAARNNLAIAQRRLAAQSST